MKQLPRCSRWMIGAVLLAAFASQVGAQGRGPETVRAQLSGIFKSYDGATNTITISTFVGDPRAVRERGEAPPMKDVALPLAKGAEVAAPTASGIGNGRGAGLLFKEVKLTDVAAGVRTGLTLSADEKSVESVVVEGPLVTGKLKAVDGTKNQVTLVLPPQGGRGRDGGEARAEEDKTYDVASDAEIAVDDGKGGRFSAHAARLSDIAQNATVTVRLSVNLKQVEFLLAEGPTYIGSIKAIDPAKNSLTLVTRPARGDDGGEEQALVISTDAVVVTDDGKGRRLSLKRAKLADIPVGAFATVRLSADQAFVTALRAEGAMVMGQLKSVDATKGTITIAIPKGRGEEPEERSLTIAKDAHVMMDGTATPLANLKAGDSPLFVQLRLALDQKTVQSVVARQAGSR